MVLEKVILLFESITRLSKNTKAKGITEVKKSKRLIRSRYPMREKIT